jgi:hypothetical protein
MILMMYILERAPYEWVGVKVLAVVTTRSVLGCDAVQDSGNRQHFGGTRCLHLTTHTHTHTHTHARTHTCYWWWSTSEEQRTAGMKSTGFNFCWEVPGLNCGHDTNYPGLIPQIRSWLFSSTSFHVHYSLRILPSVVWHCVVQQKFPGDSEECAASVGSMWVSQANNQQANMCQTACLTLHWCWRLSQYILPTCNMLWLLVTANGSLICVSLIMESICSSKTLFLTRSTWCNIPEDGVLHSSDNFCWTSPIYRQFTLP